MLASVVKYVASGGIPAFWIGSECVDQNDEKAKIAAMQAMDVICGNSPSPIGMLPIPVQVSRRTPLLVQLLNENLVARSSLLQGTMLAAKVRGVVDILLRVVCDLR